MEPEKRLRLSDIIDFKTIFAKEIVMEDGSKGFLVYRKEEQK